MFRRIKNLKSSKEFENFEVETRGDSSAVSVVDKKLTGQPGITLL